MIMVTTKARIFAKEEDVRGFGDTAMTPTIGVSSNERGQHIIYWWKPPDDMLLHEINNMLNEGNVRKLSSVDFSTGGDHGKGRFRHMLTAALRFREGEPDIIVRFIIGELDSAKDSFHYVHKEALHLLRLHRGVGELSLEDHLEQSHQKMDRNHQRLARLGFGMNRAITGHEAAKRESLAGS
jgi:hypothetical protein